MRRAVRCHAATKEAVDVSARVLLAAVRLAVPVSSTLVLSALALAMLVFPAQANAQSGKTQRLKAAGLEVDFVRWAPGPTGDIPFMTRARRAHLRDTAVDVAVAAKHFHVKVARDGNVSVRRTNVVDVITRAGVDEHSDLGFAFNAHTTTVDIVAAYARDSDGKQTPVAPGSVQIRTLNDADIFTNAFEVVLPYPAVKPGTSLVLVTEERFDASKSPVPWSAVLFTQLATHVDDFRLRVEWARGIDPPRVESNQLIMRCSDDGPRARECAVQSLAPFDMEQSAFGLLDLLPHVSISLNPDWSSLARAVEGFTLDKLTGATSVRDTLKTLAPAGSKRERFEAIHAFVAREIRYLGLEQEEGAYVARPSATTLERGYGDCKDKTVLFLDLARLAGIRAWPVLVASGRFDADKLLAPAASYFDHMIACADLGDGKPACVDLTDNGAEAGTLSHEIAGAVALALDGGEVFPVNLQPRSTNFTVSASAELTFNPDGSMTEERSTAYHGEWAALLREQVAGLPAAERQIWLDERQSLLVRGGARARESRLEGVTPASSSLTMTSSIHYDDAYGAEASRVLVSRDWTLAEAVASLYPLGNRLRALAVIGIRMESNLSYDSQARNLPYANDDVEVESRFGSLRRNRVTDGPTTIIRTVLDVPRQQIRLGEAHLFKAFLDDVLKSGLVLVAVSKDRQGFAGRGTSGVRETTAAEDGGGDQ